MTIPAPLANLQLHVHSNVNGSREYEQSAAGSETSGVAAAEDLGTQPPHDHFQDLQVVLRAQEQGSDDDHPVIVPPNRDLNVLRPENPTIGEMEELDLRYHNDLFKGLPAQRYLGPEHGPQSKVTSFRLKDLPHECSEKYKKNTAIFASFS